MKPLRLATFNVNQFSTPAHQLADLKARMGAVDVVFVQEAVHIDLLAFAATMPGWAAFQQRNGDNDGHANTAVLYRTVLGKVTDTTLVDLGRADGAKPDEHSRERFLAGVEINGADWYVSFHGFPMRDDAANPTLLKKARAWIATQHAAGKRVTCGCDKNQITIAALVKATGLDWYGIKIDGFLSAQRISNLAEFNKGFSDHPGVHGLTAKEKRVSRLQHILRLLRQAMRRARANGHEKRAAKEKAAIEALKKGKPAPTPDPTPVTHFPAIAAARKQSHDGPKGGEGMCLQMVRTCFGIRALEPDATTAWLRATDKHPLTDPAKFPRGYPIFWTGGSHGHGHIAIATGDGRCWSTDIVRTGYFDYVDITEIHNTWGLTLVGYTKDINGSKVVAEK